MLVHIFYHKKDLDGHCSGAIARHYFEENGDDVVMWPYDYGEPFPFDKISEGDSVWMIDITTNPYETMQKIKQKYNLFVIDHHKSFMNSDSREGIHGVFVEGVAACQLAWHHFFINEPTPGLVHLLGQYDVWNNEDKDFWENKVMPTQMGMRMKATDPGTDEGHALWREYFKDALDKTERMFPKIDRHYLNLEDEIEKNGKVIIQYQEMEDKKAISFYSFDAEFEGLKAICLNTVRFNSQVYKSVWDNTKYDIMLAWVSVKGESCTVSMYTDKEGIDVSEIAKRLGGGGHKQAAGFQCRELNAKIISADEKVITIVK